MWTLPLSVGTWLLRVSTALGQQQEGGSLAVPGNCLDFGLLNHTSRDQEWGNLSGLRAQTGACPVLAGLQKEIWILYPQAKVLLLPSYFQHEGEGGFPSHSLFVFPWVSAGRGGEYAASQAEGQPPSKQ